MREQPYADKHHILFNRQEWELRSEALALRTNDSLIPLLDRQVHNELHRRCTSVPLLGQYALFRTMREFEPVPEDTMKSMDNLMGSIEIAAKNPKAHSIEKSLAYLAVQAIDIQRPYIREGLLENKPTGRTTKL